MICQTLTVFLVAVLALAKCQNREGDSCVDNYTNTVGRCKPAEACTSARNDFQKNGVRPTFCTYSAFGTTLVCCRDGTSILHTAPPRTVPPGWNEPNRQADTRRVSERSNEMTSAMPTVEEITEAYEHTNKIPHTHKNGRRDTIETYDKDYATKTLEEDLKYSEEELYSKLWAIKLMKLTPEQRRFAEKMINDVLFEAESCLLTKERTHFLYSPTKCSDEQNKMAVESAKLNEDVGGTPETDMKESIEPFFAYLLNWEKISRQNAQ